MIGQNVLLMLLLVLLLLEEGTHAKIVSLPHQLYVLEGVNDTVGCQNRSMDGQTFYSYVSNAVWWHHETNGTITRIKTFGSVYSSGHKLYFNPFLNESQGNYYCCLPDGSACSNNSTVKQAISPIIRAFNSSYTAAVGSQVTLKCNIIDRGIPTGTLSWNKNGSVIHGDIIVTGSFTGLMLNNLSMEDAGMYTCLARNGYELSNHSDSIELTVITKIKYMGNEPSNESFLRVLAVEIRSTCKLFESGVPVKLRRYIYENYHHEVSINTIEIKCNDEESIAICYLQFIGSSARSALQLFTNDLNNSSGGIDLNICRLRLCNQNCQKYLANDEGIDTNHNKKSSNLIVTILLVVVILCAVVVILLCLVLLRLRCRNQKHNIVRIPMQKCVINNNSSATVDTISVTTSLSYQSSQGLYNKLQFDYNVKHIAPLKENLPVSPGPGVMLSHAYDHFDHKTDSRSRQTTSSSHDAVGNTIMLQENNHESLDGFRNELHMQNTLKEVGSKLTSECHGQTIIPQILMPYTPSSDENHPSQNDNEIVQTSTLQALIPSSKSDENYTVTPSQTHESYFDVKLHVF